MWRIKEEPALWRRYWQDGLALLGLLVKRVLPGVLAARRARAARDRQPAPSVDVRTENGVRRVTLGGAWHAGNLAPLRLALTAATATRADIVLDLTAVSALDSATVALLMLLYGHQSKIGRGYEPIGAGKELKRALTLHCAEYLLTPLPVAAAVARA